MTQDIQQYPRAIQQGLSSVSMPSRIHGKETQLRFNLDVATHPANLASQFSNPSPIIIEKISASQNKATENVAPEDRLRNSLSFSAVSEERLNLALQLAKRDLKLKHFGQKAEVKTERHPPNQGRTVTHNHGKANKKSKKSGTNQAMKYDVTESGAKVYVYTPDQSRINVGVSESPPTHDTGPGESPNKGIEPSEQQVKRLQKELHMYMRKIEELAKKGHCGEVLDPSEEARGRIRQQQRMARSARMLYVLQQQVKEIQEDLEKLSPQKIKHTKKTRTMSRLAAVHRGAIRALQMFITQLSERGEQQIPSLYKELGQLIRQLSLCTAKLESGSGSGSSDIIISILQQVEDLDILLQEKIYSQTKKPSPDISACRSSPTRKAFSNAEPFIQPVYKEIEPPKEDLRRVNRRLDLENPPELLSVPSHIEPELGHQSSTPERRAALRSGLDALIQAGHLNGVPKKGVGQSRHKGVLLPKRPKVFRQPRKTDPAKPAHFQEKTVAFKLKENQPIVREKKTPWVPPNPTSPPASPKRVNWARESKRSGVSPSGQLDPIYSLKANQAEKEDSAKEEALRLAWLDSETAKRMQQLDELYREEIAHLRTLREEADALKRLPESDKGGDSASRQQAHKNISSGNGDGENLQELIQLPGKEYSHLFQQDENNLEAMIQRMEEIEQYQEAVRKRFTRIVYSDPEFWVQEERERTQVNKDQRPQSPHPIQITKPTGHVEPVVNIRLEEPFEGDSLQIKKEELDRSSPHHFIQCSPSSTKDHSCLSVPMQMLQSIHNYTESYNRHLRLTSHEEVGNFNPWHISESLADELINGALGEVAAELQDLCEGYAEAVFTSEFMEPSSS